MTIIDDLKAKAVLITGASSGIGAALARAFAAQGSRLALHFNAHEEAAQALAREIAVNAPAPTLVRGDLSKRGEARRVVNEAATALGGLDVLINNAGGLGERRPIAEVDDCALFDFRLTTSTCGRSSRRLARPRGRGAGLHRCIPFLAVE